VAVLTFILWYLFPALRNTSNEFSAAEASLTLDSVKQSKQIKDVYEKIEQNPEINDELFEKPVRPLDLISLWEKIAEEEKLIIEISPNDAEKYQNDPWDFLGFKITLSGNFINIQKFIEKTETSKYLFQIDNLIIKRDIPKKVTATILLKAYNKKDGK